MKISLVLFSLLLSGLCFAGLEAGSFSGSDGKGKDFELHVRELPEREGSFLAILMSDKDKTARTYLIDSFGANKYGLLSLRITANYNIGISNTTPTLVLSNSKDSFVINSNGGQPDVTFNSAITFKSSKKEQLRWTDLIAGDYEGKLASLSAVDSDNEASASLKLNNFNGDYVLRESRPNLFLLLQSQLTPTGVKLAKDATAYAFFLSGSRFSPARMVIVNDSNGQFETVKAK